MISIIKMISALFLLSLFTILGSQARMLPAGENGIFKTISNNKKENKWISMVAEQITASSFMISNYRKKPPRSPPPPRSSTPKQPGINEYSKKPRPPPPSPLKSGITIISSIIKRPARSPPPAPAASPPKKGINEYQKSPKSPPPPPYISPTKGHLSWTTNTLKWRMRSEYAVTAKSPPPPPYTAPTIVPVIKLYG